MRALHRDVLRLACGLYPAHRVLDYLVQGLACKSNRTKIECCGACGRLMLWQAQCVRPRLLLGVYGCPGLSLPRLHCQ